MGPLTCKMYAWGQAYLLTDISFSVSLGSHFFMSLKQIPIKLGRFSKFGMINNLNHGGDFLFVLKNAKKKC